MNGFINFISTNYRLILEVVLLIVSVVIFILRKKPVEVTKTIMELIYTLVPQEINSYERFYGSGHGTEKKKSVVDFVLAEIERKYALNDAQRSFYTSLIKSVIEEILSTPQKKGGHKDGK